MDRVCDPRRVSSIDRAPARSETHGRARDAPSAARTVRFLAERATTGLAEEDAERAFAMLRRAPRSAVLTDATAAIVVRATGEWCPHESRKTTWLLVDRVSGRCVVGSGQSELLGTGSFDWIRIGSRDLTVC